MALLFGKKIMKPKLFVFSTFDICFMVSVIVLTGLLVITPLFNDNNQAFLYMLREKHDKAEQKWNYLINKEPFVPFYRMNLALNYLLNNQADRAIQEYMITSNLVRQIKKQERFKKQKDPRFRGDDIFQRDGDSRRNEGLHGDDDSRRDDGFRGDRRHSRASGNPDKEKKQNPLNLYKKKVLFYSSFNSAVAATPKKEIREVLNFYQKALAFQPDSLEVKTNIELLIKSQKPPRNKGASQKSDQSQKEEKKNKEESKKEKKEGERKKEGNQENQDKEKEEKKHKQKSDDSGESKEKKEGAGTSSSKKRKKEGQGDSKNPIDKKKMEAILKAILEAEKKIRERRNKATRDSSVLEKDW